MKKLIKFVSIILFMLFFANATYATNVTIYVPGHQIWENQNNNTMVLRCVAPFDVTCLIIVINDSGTYVFFDTGNNNSGVQVENNYVEETDENGNKYFEFTPVN